MDEFLAVAFGFPTLCLTIPLVLLCLYWITVTLGVLDIDALGGADAGAEGAIEAAAGKMEGMLDAAAGKLEGTLDAAAAKMEAAAHAASSAAEHAEGAGSPVVELLSALRLRRAPVTVVLTVLVLFAWIVSFMGARHVVPILPLPGFLSSTLVLLLSLLVAWPFTALVTFPMGPLYATHPAVTHAELVGKRVVVSTSRVTETFGEAELKDGGAGLLLQIRCASPNELVKHSEALLVAWHADRDFFDVEPMNALLEDRPNAS